ncbi:MAG TPA: DUF2461 family protein [Gemmatimonadales bacterium]|nr:DUF2461 family protein [Gemmatimonadales bacterium]
MFTTESLGFLRGLARHNNKPWFEAHRESYERDVRAPMRALIEEIAGTQARDFTLAPAVGKFCSAGSRQLGATWRLALGVL